MQVEILFFCGFCYFIPENTLYIENMIDSSAKIIPLLIPSTVLHEYWWELWSYYTTI